MLVFYPTNYCSVSAVNFSLKRHDIPVYQYQEYMLMIWLIPISLLAGLVNAFSLWIFLRQTFENKAVLFNLVAISLSEVFLQSSVLLEAGMVLSQMEHSHTVSSYLVTSIVHIYVNSCFSVRNWNVVLLSASRCEVVCLPLSSRNRLFFTSGKLQVGQVLVTLLSVGLAIVHNLKEYGLVCGNVNDMVLPQPLLNNFPTYRYYELYGIFMFQCCIPIILISMATVCIYYKLRQQDQGGGGESASTGAAAASTSILRRSDRRPATAAECTVALEWRHSRGRLLARHNSRGSLRRGTSYLILLLSGLFCLLQLPTFIVTCVLLFQSDIQFLIHPDLFTNTLCVVDSLLNFFVYAASSYQFRRTAIHSMPCCKSALHRDKDKEGGGLGVRSERMQQHFQRSVNSPSDIIP